MPPTPSVIEWCTFIANAAVAPPSSPSNRVNSHNGRARSNEHDAIGCSASRRVGASPGGGRRSRRRWKSRSNVDSTAQRGGPMRNGGESTRWRKRGMSACCALDACAQATPVRRLVVDGDREDRRSEDRILLDVPHERVLVAHVMRETRFRHRSSQRPGGYSPSRAPGGHRAVERDDGAADERGGGRTQERDGRAHFLGPAEPAHGRAAPRPCAARLPGRLIASCDAREESGVGRGGRHDVDADAVGRRARSRPASRGSRAHPWTRNTPRSRAPPSRRAPSRAARPRRLRCSAITGMPCFMHRNGPFRFTSMTRCHSLVAAVDRPSDRVSTAAEHTSASSRPSRSRIASTIAATSPSLVTSTVIASTVRPAAVRLSATCCARGSSTSATTTRSPSSANRLTIASPKSGRATGDDDDARPRGVRPLTSPQRREAAVARG